MCNPERFPGLEIEHVMIWISSSTFPKQNLGNSSARHHPLSKCDFQFALRFFAWFSKSKIVKVVFQVLFSGVHAIFSYIVFGCI